MATEKKRSRARSQAKRSSKSKRGRSSKARALAKVHKPDPAETPQDPVAACAVSPLITGAAIAARFGVFPHKRSEGEFIGDLAGELSRQCERVLDGDLIRVESMLVSQAHSLDVLFACLALKARENMGQYLDATDRYMRLALRAQSQCRATLETLATIKNPPLVFAKQANIAHGHQQVNNGEAVTVARAGDNTSQQSKLLEASHGHAEWMDAGAAGETTAGDPPLATVETLDRTAHG